MDQHLYTAALAALVARGCELKAAEAAALVVANDRPDKERTPQEQAIVTKAWRQINATADRAN